MLIAIEGIDASGKHTQAHLLKAKAQSVGLRVETLSFPRYGETLFAKSVADYLNGKFGSLASVDPHLSALLYAGDRFESRSTILQLSQSYDVLILDRYVASNLAYQAAKVDREGRQEFISWLTRIEYEIYGLPRADLTVYLDIPAEIASKMIYERKRQSYNTEVADIHDREPQYLSVCREVYLLLASMNYCSTWLSIQCSRPDGQMREALEICDSIWDGIKHNMSIAQSRNSSA